MRTESNRRVLARRARRIGRALAAALLVGPIGAPQGIAGATSADPGDPRQVARGADIYRENCASCHGAALEGHPDWQRRGADGIYPAPPHDADGHTWHHSDRLLFRYTKLGGAAALGDVPGFRSGMPGFGDRLSDQEIWDVLAFIKAQWPERERDYQRVVTANEGEYEGEGRSGRQ